MAILKLWLIKAAGWLESLLVQHRNQRLCDWLLDHPWWGPATSYEYEETGRVVFPEVDVKLSDEWYPRITDISPLYDDDDART